MERIPNKSQHRKLTLEKKKSPAASAGIRTLNLSFTSPVLYQQAITTLHMDKNLFFLIAFTSVYVSIPGKPELRQIQLRFTIQMPGLGGERGGGVFFFWEKKSFRRFKSWDQLRGEKQGKTVYPRIL